MVDERFSIAENGVQPVQRARRTYGSKAKTSTAANEGNGSDAHSSSLSGPLLREPAALSSIATSTTTYQASDWRQDLAKIDQDMPLSDDENESRDAVATSSMSRFTSHCISPRRHSRLFRISLLC